MMHQLKRCIPKDTESIIKEAESTLVTEKEKTLSPEPIKEKKQSINSSY